MGSPLDMKLEVVVIPVSDIERAKRFYGGLGWTLDGEFAVGDVFHVVGLAVLSQQPLDRLPVSS